ncbi:hypothetical protein ACN079_01260 [Pseudomonas sp. ABY48]|uniref:hypothetical protein n=1 Tax=Pseudomonas sp. ABY48 TaxID=3402865 RepID=UPI003B42C9AC
MFRSLCVSLPTCALLLLCDSPQAENGRYSWRTDAASVPRLRGSDEQVVAPALGAQITRSHGVFLDSDQGQGWAFDEEDFGLSVFIGASDVRKDRKRGLKDSDEPSDMGSLKSRPVLGLDGTYQMGPVTREATFEHALDQPS